MLTEIKQLKTKENRKQEGERDRETDRHREVSM